jgi:outer membrane receptor protein involved in Fe transport
VTNLNGTISRWRTYNTLTYKLNDFLAAIGHTYYPATADAVWTPASQADGYPAKIPAYSVWDAHVSYTFRGDKTWFRGLTLTVGENNIRNRLPPKSAAFDGLSNADVGEFSPIGRFTYVEGSYRF